MKFINELREGEKISGIYLCKHKQAAVTKNGKPYENLILQDKTGSANGTDDKIKRMMVHIHEHYSEKISIPELAEVAFLSERECYRAFRNHLHMTPVEYIKSYRIQRARQMLADTQTPITEIGYACGLGNPSYFGRIFRELTGYTPLEYRRKWQNRDKK